jgi:guanine nucleotide-binding protein subunit alpha
MGRSYDDNLDPLARITAPPVNETPEQRRTREREEANAKKVSEQIDETLRAEREEGKAKRKNRLKVLLLGQSESGAFNRFKLSKFPRSSLSGVRPFASRSTSSG